jgi:hypothetical protein
LAGECLDNDAPIPRRKAVLNRLIAKIANLSLNSAWFARAATSAPQPDE